MKGGQKINEEEILASAKTIMANFMQELERVKEAKEEFGQRRSANTRLREEINKSDADFIKRMFANAPKRRDGYIIAERKKEE